MLIAGGGSACLEKLMGLSEIPCQIQIVSPEISPAVHEFISGKPNIHVILRTLVETDLEGKDLIFLATNNGKTNAEFRNLANQKGIWVNAVDDPVNCDFFSASQVKVGSIRFAISTEGNFAGISSLLRQILEELIPVEHADDFEALFEIRRQLKLRLSDPQKRKLALQSVIKQLRETYFQ
ncbi:siroheme synthase domain protein [Leptospira ryugenii]|uniref:precorrin-2 dehydrogenase n=1 Tax=Leptospira ryugenii TaxID=1917863 RepID=A0A2P2DVH6_9LEPT|nr:siroheme synthase domain protein [Leptospira ryugenii]